METSVTVSFCQKQVNIMADNRLVLWQSCYAESLTHYCYNTMIGQ